MKSKTYEDECEQCFQRKVVLIPVNTYSSTGHLINKQQWCLECIRYDANVDAHPTKAWNV